VARVAAECARERQFANGSTARQARHDRFERLACADFGRCASGRIEEERHARLVRRRRRAVAIASDPNEIVQHLLFEQDIRTNKHERLMVSRLFERRRALGSLSHRDSARSQPPIGRRVERATAPDADRTEFCSMHKQDGPLGQGQPTHHDRGLIIENQRRNGPSHPRAS